jgi:hypothetical protein
MPIPHWKVIENFVKKGDGGRGTNVVAKEEDGAVYSTYNHSWADRGIGIPLAVRLEDGGFLANGARLSWPSDWHQTLVLRTLEESKVPFGVVPLDSVTAAWTDGKIRNWNQAPFSLKDLRKEVEIVVPSVGERWREVEIKDKYGKVVRTRTVHTLGDSVVRVQDHFYLSGVDETGWWGRGIYFLAELVTDQAPRTFAEALNFLKPKVVQDAEMRGAYVRRQGEWFAIPTKLTTSQLLRDIERGVAVRHENHILGRDGHHRLEEAVIYRFGPQRGEVYARGMLIHIKDEHDPLDLGFRWHLIVHNVQGASYSLAGNFD